MSLTTSNLTSPESRELQRREELLYFERGVTFCEAQGATLCKNKAELQTLLKLIATLWKQGQFSGVCREFIYRHHVMFQEHFYVPTELLFPIALIYKNQFWTSWKRAASIIYGTCMDIDFSLTKFERIHAIPHPEPPSKTDVSSRPETIWPEVWLSMSKCAQRKAKQQRDVEKNKNTSCTSEGEESPRYFTRRS